MHWPFVGRRERLRREAADWVARLNGPSSEEHRAEFERWYRSSADHSAAYDRLSALFEVAGRASRRAPAKGAMSPVPLRPIRAWAARYALAAGVAVALLVAGVLIFAGRTAQFDRTEPQVARFAAPSSETRRLILADGSEVLLSPGSVLTVDLGNRERRLRLAKGSARFAVAHEARPFVVATAGTEVVARGTRFVVTLDGGRTTVALLDGIVDVSYPADPGAEQRRVARLRPGERIVVESGRVQTARPGSAELSGEGPKPVPAMLQFDGAPLGQAVGEASRHGSPRIRLRDPSLAALRITGGFRAGDTAGLAESVAAVFRLEIERAEDGTLWLKPGSGAPRAH